jgi:galactose mutarotase-like enzyme
MKTLSTKSVAPVNGHRSLVVENDQLRLQILPELGARIWQIHSKPLSVDLLWNNPHLAPGKPAFGSSYDENWSGGWDELFPNDEATIYKGKSLPDHGELWTCDWAIDEPATPNPLTLKFTLHTPVSNFCIEKTICLHPSSANFEVHYKLTNHGSDKFPFLFKLHPAFAVSSEHRIDFAPMKILLEPEFAGTLAAAVSEFYWPFAQIGQQCVDLRKAPARNSGALHFFYGDELADGWCGITNRANGLAVALRYDPAVFTSCWLFATHGGWKNLNVAVLEPATGYPFRFHSMIEGKRALWLEPGESLRTTVLFAVQEGMSSIGGVDADGKILPGLD